MFASNIVIQLRADRDQLSVQLPVNELCPVDFYLPIYLTDAWAFALRKWEILCCDIELEYIQ